jgi:hypothetical protein
MNRPDNFASFVGLLARETKSDFQISGQGAVPKRFQARASLTGIHFPPTFPEPATGHRIAETCVGRLWTFYLRLGHAMQYPDHRPSDKENVRLQTRGLRFSFSFSLYGAKRRASTSFLGVLFLFSALSLCFNQGLNRNYINTNQ